MMQRTASLFVALALGGSAIAYLTVGEFGALAVGLAAVAGALGGLLAAPRPAIASRATVRTVPARRTAPLARVPHARASLAMEPGQAVMVDPHTKSLRLTGDILRGMQTHGKVTRGKCSQCSSTLWLSAQRPVKARCPVCGFTRVLSR
jgi:hypothetical protein